MSAVPGLAPRTDAEWARSIEQRFRALENPTTTRVGPWVLSSDAAGALIATKPGNSLVINEFGAPVKVDIGNLRGFTQADHDQVVEDAKKSAWEELYAKLSGSAGPADALQALADFFDAQFNSPIDALRIFGQLLPGQIGNISISHIGGAFEPELLTNPKFMGAGSLSGQSLWDYDETKGHTEPGTAHTTADGVERELLSNYIIVSEGQQLRGSAWAMWQGLASTGSPIRLEYSMFEQGAPRGTLPLDELVSPGSSSGWTKLSGTATIPANVDSVRLRLVVTNTATAGDVWFDDGSASKFGLLPQAFINGLTQIIDLFKSLFDAVGGVVGTGIHEIQTRLAAIGLNGQFDAAELTNLSNSVIQTLKDTIGGTIGAGWTDIQNRLSGLNPLGQLNVAKLLGQLPHGQVTSPVGGTSLGGDLGKMLDGFWNTVFGTSASGKNTDDFITATGALKQTADDAMAAAIYASDLINLPRRSPRWMSTGTHDDVSFPIVNASTTFTPALGKLVLIPVTPDVARLYKAVKVGITATGMTSLYVGLYRIDSGGNIVLDTNLGNVKSSVTASKIQTFAIPDPYFSVDRGETVFIGALQVGGTAAPILTNNAMLSVLESVQPVPLYFAQDGGSSLSSLPSTVGVSVELSPAWGALGEVHLVSSWLDFTTPSVDPATWVFPSTARYLDLVVCTAGGGGGGGDGGWNKPGEGGKPGVWLGRRVERGVDIPWGITQLKYWVQVVGKGAAGKETDGWQGGGFTSIGPGADQPLWFYTDPSTNLRVNLIVGKGGTGGRLAYGNFNNWDPVGYGPGNFAFGGRLFIGGANTATPPSSGAGRGYNGNLPGGGGSGGSGGTGGNAGGGGDGGPGFAAARAT